MYFGQMIFRTTYANEEYEKATKKFVGGPFSFLEKLRMRGVGSGRMMVAGMSEKLQPKQVQFAEIDYANIELRSNGVIVHFTNRLERYSWLIPYYRLVIFNNKHYTIHSDGNFIQFHKNNNYLKNKKFLDKMIDLKIEVLELGYYDG